MEKDYHQFRIEFKATEKTLQAFLPILKMVEGLKDLRVIRRKIKTTEQQRKALHLWFGWLAKNLNEAGWDMKKTLRPTIDIPWTKESIKKFLWKPLQLAKFDIKSTKKLDRTQINPILEIIAREIGGRTGVEIPPFPDRALLEQEREQENLLRIPSQNH